MKKVILLIIGMLCVKLCTSQVQIGVKTGVTISTFVGDNWKPLEQYTLGRTTFEETYKSPFRYFLPVIISGNVEINEKISIQPELLYTKRGMSLSQSQKINVGDIDILHKFNHQVALHYIDLPVFINYSFRERLVVKTGIQFSLLTWASTKTLYDFEFIDPLNNELITSETFLNETDKGAISFRRFDLSIAAGAGYEFDSGMCLGIRTFYSMINIYKENFSYKNLSTQVVIGYLLDL
ncbi:MAG: hypothetical protein COC01_01595 [Bacteroidetes bacterium]|nr:MAG: hypothetical protein COC01_01595 [Bacteroidota bacterium]